MDVIIDVHEGHTYSVWAVMRLVAAGGVRAPPRTAGDR
jgi:hypothetical protein